MILYGCTGRCGKTIRMEEELRKAKKDGKKVYVWTKEDLGDNDERRRFIIIDK